MKATGHTNTNMQTASAPLPPVAETDSVPLQINLLALNLAIELARLRGSERAAALPRLAACDLSELLDDDLQQMGAGEGLRLAVEELQRALRQAGELALRAPAPDSALAEASERAEVGGR